MCVYLCSVLQMFLWKNHARLLQNQQDWQFKSIFSPFLTLHEWPRDEVGPGRLSGTVAHCLAGALHRWGHWRTACTASPPEGFSLRCPQRIPRAAAAQKPPVHSILISTMSKFPWRFVLGRMSLSTTVSAHGSAAVSLQHTWKLSAFGSLLSFCTFPFDHNDHYFVLVEIFNFCH